MSRHVSVLVSLISLLAFACSPLLDRATKNPSAQEVAATNASQCQTHAKSRLSLFDRPDTYPISETEKQNAYQALYHECMRKYDVQIAGAKPGFEVAANTPAELAQLSPAAGMKKGFTAYPSGVTVIDAAQFATLSPASGGTIPGITSATSGSGSTVVVIQAPPATPSSAATPARQAAIPVERTASHPPATAMYKPKDLMAKSLMEEKKEAATAPTSPPPETKPKKSVAKPKRVSAKVKPPADADPRTRFQKNAIPFTVDISRKQVELNTLQPSAGGKALDKAVSINPLPAKD
jgi:hypothetical protein